MAELLLSIVALMAAPLIVRGLRNTPALYAIDGFVLMAIAGLCIFHLLPEAAASAGPAVLGAAIIGFAIPSWTERALKGAHQGAHRIVVGAALLALALHSALDGAALSMQGGDPESTRALALAILLHRLPVGLMLWLTVRPLFGKRGAWIALGAVSATTVLGFYASQSVVTSASSPVVAWLLAGVAGALLHVLTHQAPAAERRQPPQPVWGALGGLLALGALAWMSLDRAGTDSDSTDVLSFLWFLAVGFWMPVLVGGMLSSLLVGSLKAPSLKALRKGTPVTAVRLALSNPVCSCGILPVYEDLVGHGVKRKVSIAFLVSAPVLSLEALVLGLFLFGWQLALAWAVGAFVLASLSAWLFGGLLATKPDAAIMHAPLEGSGDPQAPESEPVRSGVLTRTMDYFTNDWLEHFSAWIGLALVAVFGLLYLPFDLFDLAISDLLKDHSMVAILLAGLVAFPLYVNPAAAWILAYALYYLGFPPGALIAFVALAPATGVAGRRTLVRLHGKQAGWTFTAVLTGAAIGLGYVAQLALGGVVTRQVTMASSGAARWTEDLLAFGETAGVVGSGLLIALLLLPVLVSFMRCGPRGWLAEVLPAEEHEHAHHPGAPHEHVARTQVQVDAGD